MAALTFFIATAALPKRFSREDDVANNPLKPLLERYFGPELDMRQT